MTACKHNTPILVKDTCVYTHTHTHVCTLTLNTPYSVVIDDQFGFQSELRVSPENGRQAAVCCFSLPLSSFDLCVCVCVCVCTCAWCVCSHRPIPGLKLVPARSPNGSIDHCSVPFSNQRTAVVASSTQEITHFNEETVIIFSLQRGREGGETMRETRM